MHTIPSSPASSMSSFSPNSSQSQSKNNSQSVSNGSPNSARGFNSSSSRQPIHTPLISTQPVCVFVVFLSIFKQICIDMFKRRTLHLSLHSNRNHTNENEFIWIEIVHNVRKSKCSKPKFNCNDKIAERVNRPIGTDRRRKANIDRRRLSHSNQASAYKIRREIPQKNPAEN